MTTSIGKIKIGHANTLRLRLKATDVDTGSLINLTSSQMQAITKISLDLDGSNKITTGDTGVALGAGKEFDPTVDPTDAILIIDLGSVAALADLIGSYNTPHLDVWFSDVKGGEVPVSFELFPINVTA